ncbi:hypothetical protein QBC40DRAFT_226664 [Triangularia verruculosa]|uniref:ATP-dependent RNA helicase DHX8 n=1 Tax=Triangularia verruculosa TaxID=2587418 RepID=A0AAN6XIK6_9PEZI|nr:hypothetical protein QBC40DRAFT_226664 [Triangularia verruculosa]
MSTTSFLEASASPIPYKQIRALFNTQTITLYQAYNPAIATAAVTHQKLNASPLFKTTRMTWIKPSWAWMLCRSGYSFKDPNQSRILALSINHSDFLWLLSQGVVSHRNPEEKEKDGGKKLTGVRIQWDPERDVKMEKLRHRSIQIGIPGGEVCERWLGMIVKIEDLTDKARELKRVIDERPEVMVEELREMGLVPEERVFEIEDGEVRKKLGMDWPSSEVSVE